MSCQSAPATEVSMITSESNPTQSSSDHIGVKSHRV
ncbi:unnamed protein product [Staurois parvus]|uniref:Uncharacterized protein n=1 Tax=Staurois parvus TaxID=386267 RepID=A0ABN9GMC8_9NEOB|nr:unnamed protein product [Staurois parvus]